MKSIGRVRVQQRRNKRVMWTLQPHPGDFAGVGEGTTLTAIAGLCAQGRSPLRLAVVMKLRTTCAKRRP
jgi:hypothetical protein